MFELILTGAILAAATAAFTAFWNVVYDWCLKWALKFIDSFTTLVRAGYNVISYYYHREHDGWYKEEVPAQRVAKSECPKSVRDALFDYDEVIVKRY